MRPLRTVIMSADNLTRFSLDMAHYATIFLFALFSPKARLAERLLFRDNDGIYGHGVAAFLKRCGIKLQFPSLYVEVWDRQETKPIVDPKAGQCSKVDSSGRIDSRWRTNR